MSQLIIENRQAKDFNIARLVRFTGVGAFAIAVPLHVWFGRGLPFIVGNFLPRYIPFLRNPSKWVTGVSFMIVDQSLFAPIFLAGLFSVLDTVDHRKFDPEFSNVKKCWWPALVMNYKMWPAAQLINFSVVPGSYQVLFANFVGLFFNCYISYLQNTKTPQKVESQ